MTARPGRTLRSATLLTVGAAFVVAACAPVSPSRMPAAKHRSSVLEGVRNVHQVSQITGPTSPNKTGRYGVAGQDLGSMFRADGKTWFVFGDTFGQRDPGMTGGGGTQWRSNAMAYTTDQRPEDGIHLNGYITDKSGRAKELIGSAKVDGQEMTTIPTYGFAANSAMYLDYMSVRHWGDPGEWETNYAGLAKSTDHGQTWSKLPSPRWDGNSNFVQVSVTKIDGDLYFWGVTHGRFGPVKLMKVPEAMVEEQSAYRYFAGVRADGTPEWSARPGDAAVVAAGTVGELSVVWNPYLERWLMTYTDGSGNRVAIRDSAHPWGPWSAPMTLVSGTDVPGLYAPFMLPEYTANGGRTIYFTLSKWGPYNVYWYRADLIKKR